MTVVEEGSLNSRPELEVVPRATLDDFDPELLYQWLSVYKHSVFGSLSSFTEEEGLAHSKDTVEQAILTYLAQRGIVSTAQIATAAGLSTKTVREYLNRMLEQGLVEGVGSKFSPQRRYRLAGTQGPVDVSVGATFSKGAWV